MPHFENEFRDLIHDAVEETGADLSKTKDEVAVFMSERALHLSTLTTEPGFGQAVTAERDNVALFAGLKTAEAADATGQRLLGLIGGAIRIAALALV